MNASEFSYWYRSGHGPLFGSEVSSSSPAEIFYSADSRFFGVSGGRVEAIGSWRGSPDTAQRSLENASNRLTNSPVFIYRRRGQDRVWTFGVSVGRPSQSMRQAPWEPVSTMNMPRSEDELLSMISFQGIYGAADEIERAVDGIALEGERFGGKEKRLERLEDKLLSLEESSEGASGSGSSKIKKKIARIKKKIAKLQGKLGIQPDEDEDEKDDSFGALSFESEVDEVDMDLEDLERESFGIIPALIIGAASVAPAIAMAIKGKAKRLESLKKKLSKLEAKLETVDGKKKDRLQKRIDKISDRIEKLNAKLGIEDESDEKMGLYSSHSFVPAELEDHSIDPGALGVRRAGAFGQDSSSLAVSRFSEQWLGRAGVLSVQPAQWVQGPVLLVTTANGLRPAGMPGAYEGHKIVVMSSSGPRSQLVSSIRGGLKSSASRLASRDVGETVATSMFGSIPMGPGEGPYQLWTSDAATADDGTIIAIPVFPEGTLSSAAEEGALQGVDEFLFSRGPRRR